MDIHAAPHNLYRSRCKLYCNGVLFIAEIAGQPATLAAGQHM
jgi:hypothetical protein